MKWADTPHTARHIAPPRVQHVAVVFFDLGSFSFVATGETRHEAIDAGLDLWHAHAEQYGTDPDLIAEEDMTVVEGPIGAAFRDGQLID